MHVNSVANSSLKKKILGVMHFEIFLLDYLFTLCNLHEKLISKSFNFGL